MDDDTKRVRSYMQKMTSADWLYGQAELKTARADTIQNSLDNPAPDAAAIDPATATQEIAELREQASAFNERAAEIQRGLAKPPTQDMIREVEDYFRRNPSPSINRDRER